VNGGIGALLPPQLSAAEVRRELAESRSATLWATASSKAVAEELFGVPANCASNAGLVGVSLLVAVGGGAALDRAKWERSRQGHEIRLIAVPSLWGSGAEASRIVVLNEDGQKRIDVGEKFLPDAICWSEDFLASMSPLLARWACGDSWAHALEGFLSPLATEEIRQALAGVMRSMLLMPTTRDFRWFEASAIACAGQSHSSVGLVHGIAHVLEPFLAKQTANKPWGHARLCSALLAPVMRFNLAASSKPATLLARHGLELGRVMSIADSLAEPIGPLVGPIQSLWTQILRDPCTRTNSVLVRPSSLAQILGNEAQS
jgi:alcohol dehydrogenase class IV